MSQTSSKVETVGWESVGVRMRPNIESTTDGDSPAWKGLQGVDSKWGDFQLALTLLGQSLCTSTARVYQKPSRLGG